MPSDDAKSRHVIRTSAEAVVSERRPILSAMFAPKSIALIGASEKPGSVGRALLENLQSFRDRVFPINPSHATLLGQKTFPTIGDTPQEVDLAVIATPAATVPGIVAECAAAGVKGAVIISAGFKECGPAGAELEKQILARRGKMRIIGPNCVGVMLPHIGLNATFAKPLALPGSIGFISQSGALCTAILDWSMSIQLGFSAFISIGSMADVNWGDLIDHLGDDPHTRSILLYMESVGDARAFLSAAREVALTKPIIAIKVGRTGAAAKAAASHTGALTGSDDVLDAAFRRVGVLRVDTIEELFGLAELLGKQPRPAGPRLAIVTNGGGPGVLATDALIECGGKLAEVSAKSFDQLNKLLPPHWSRGNPIDILGDANPETYAKAVEIVARDENNDGLLVILSPQAVTEPTQTAELQTPFLGVTVQPMIAHDDYEIILGSSIDAQFGPVLLFGAGGYFVEVFKDRALGLPPLNRTLARRLMERTQIYSALKKGFRGRGAIDLGALEELLVRFSQLVIEQRRIKEIDINPLLVSSKQTVALDARVVLHDASTEENDLPRSTIRPYPIECVTTRKVGGVEVTIRPIRPEDELLMVEFHRTLSDRSVYLRYSGLLSFEERTMHERLRRVCFIDYDREIALVADLKNRGGKHQILGVGRLIKEHGVDEAEFAILISDPWQGKGLGTELLKLLVQIGRKERLRRIIGRISAENATMKQVSEEVGFNLRFDKNEGEWKAELVL